MSVNSAIILLNWNGWNDTIECLTSIISLQHSSFAIIIVDNASTDGSMAKIEKWCHDSHRLFDLAHRVYKLDQSMIDGFNSELNHHDIVLIQADTNGGFATGNNFGLRVALKAGCKRMWLLNNDTTVDEMALTVLEQRMAEDAQLGMVGSVLLYHDRPNIVQAVGGVRFNFWRARGTQLGQNLSSDSPLIKKLETSKITYVAGASLLVNSAFLNEVGLMEEGYFLYFEEIDWACRAGKRWRTGIATGSHVFHKEGASIGTSSRSRRSLLSQYYINRNVIRFYRIHKPHLLIAPLIGIFLEILKLLIRGETALAMCTCSALIDGVKGHAGIRGN